MNFYFIFEGKTEPIVYKSWLSFLIPQLSEVNTYDRVNVNNYYYESDMGYPNCYNIVANAFQEINEYPQYNYLVLFLDADRLSVRERITEAHEEVSRILESNDFIYKRLPDNCQFEIIVQKVCLETWFLGNRRFFVRNPQNELLNEYIRYFDVSFNNPENLASEFIQNEEGTNLIFGYTTKALFHESYLREIFRERLRGLTYHKSKPKEVQEEHYLKQLINRINESPLDLESFQSFLVFCSRIRDRLVLD